MIFPSSLIENAINEFAKIPGVGKKTALRYILHLLNKDKKEALHFADTIATLINEVKQCSQCYNISDDEVCNICANTSRKKTTICVVENISHLIAIESTQQYNGVYHVLDGLISPLDGIGPEQLNIASLLQRTITDEVEEIILALNANIQGETTAYYIQKNLANTSVIISVISRGISFGGELDHTDEMTLVKSIQSRLAMK
jgi:recombination protein RecR